LRFELQVGLSRCAQLEDGTKDDSNLGEVTRRVGIRTWQLAALAALVVASACLGWVATDTLEAENDFCNACHLPGGAVLHAEIRDGFDAQAPRNLAGVHGGASTTKGGTKGSPPRAFRCIDCHGGVGLVARAKVKALAAKDALVWLVGDFDEPDHMEYPLGEADCRQCHEGFSSDEDEQFGQVRFHARSVHNADLGVNCVECHTVHVGGDDASTFYLEPNRVREKCGRCHSEFQEGS
jgi:nitrate/TMAO reductase-like tetraheme cytochrome c subunit